MMLPLWSTLVESLLLLNLSLCLFHTAYKCTVLILFIIAKIAVHSIVLYIYVIYRLEGPHCEKI